MPSDKNNAQDLNASYDLFNLTQHMTPQIRDHDTSIIKNSTPGMPPLMLPMHSIPYYDYCLRLPVSYHVFNAKTTNSNYPNRELTSYIENIEIDAAMGASHTEAQSAKPSYFETVLLYPAQTTDDSEAIELEDNESDVMEIS